ncbi:hypothetical protein DAPPUDRAFT_255546 [Daphnia pulex]|uniref:Uncharacterized protein n=1 Tax=Daphnia pulex TaxID=6669 RepID=E9H9G5_DAPPU|nr:hypothetical protein DAPPUDRAFT_255546 [Daphnia pulex]|eukprot:EFX71656.1 hypothetical protein DAPPUDRAFT_255546 [Daphnia pulex]
MFSSPQPSSVVLCTITVRILDAVSASYSFTLCTAYTLHSRNVVAIFVSTLKKVQNNSFHSCREMRQLDDFAI